MKKFEESVSTFRGASSKAVALFCLLAMVTVAMPVGAQSARGDRTGSKGSTAQPDTTDSVALSPSADLLIYTYSPELDSLLRFNASDPSATTQIPLTGIDAVNLEILEFIDFRPSNGVLYAVAINGTTSRVVTINTTTGAVTTAGAVTTLNAPFYGGDFNPVVDLIRETGFAGTNRRISPAGGVAGTDTNLAYAAGDPGFGTTPNVVHVAYSNNFAGATSTTLYGIDVNRDVLVTIGSPGGSPVSPNSGQLFTVGPLGVNATGYGGFDIHAGTNLAYAALTVGGSPNLYSINLTTGAATFIGEIIPPDVDLQGARIDGLSIAPGGATANLAITKSDNFTTYVPGSVRPYTIVASNSGPDPVAGALVTDTLTSQFTGFSWTCTGTGGGTCPASGSGSIAALVNIPVGGTVTFQVQATVSPSATGNLVNSASIASPAGVSDSNVVNNGSTDTNTPLTTAAGVMISGRVMGPDGRALRGARVTAVNSDGVPVTVLTSSLGYYTFEDVEPATYILSVASKRYRFDPRPVSVTDSLTNVDFVGIE
jgi:uncharacterized repeat protein (TIGR01451 family)